MATMQDFRTSQDLLAELTQIFHTGDPSENRDVRQKAFRVSSLLAASLQTPQELAFETCFGPAYTACCRAGVHLHLFEAIAGSNGPITAGELATKTGSERLLLVRLLRVITTLGVVAEVGPETYQAVPATHAMASPMVCAAYQHFWDQALSSLLHLPSFLASHGSRCPTDARNGLFQHAFSTSLDAFSYWQSQPPPRRALDNFNFLMTCIRGEEPMWLSWFPIHERILEGVSPDGVVFVDVGGGLGHDVTAFRRKVGADFPKNGRLVLQDLSAVLKDPAQLEMEGLERIPYDFFTAQAVEGARVYYYAHILHDWSDEACHRILRGVRSAMKPGYSKLLLYEFILPETGCPRLQAGFDIQMMGMHAGMERTAAQWTRLLENAGFAVVKFWMPPAADMEGIVEAEVVDSHTQSNGVHV